MLQTLIQALMLGMGISQDHIGGTFTVEEKNFMLEIAQLEYKWRIGKKKQAKLAEFRDTTESLTQRFANQESNRV